MSFEYHKFLNEPIFFPYWKVETIFLGTFNPLHGEPVDYYYRRKSNGFWKILNRYNTAENHLQDFSFEQLVNFMQTKRFGCSDTIISVTFPEADTQKIIGSGYSDNNLFRVKNYVRLYNFESLKSYLTSNQVRNVFTTWGARKNPKDFKSGIEELQSFCMDHSINYVALKSPSGRIYKGSKIDQINANWWYYLDNLFF